MRQHCLLLLETADSSRKRVIWPHGWALCRENTRPEGSRSSSGSASEATSMSVNCRSMVPDPASDTSTEQRIDWESGWMVFKPECIQTKLLSHLPPKWPG